MEPLLAVLIVAALFLTGCNTVRACARISMTRARLSWTPVLELSGNGYACWPEPKIRASLRTTL